MNDSEAIILGAVSQRRGTLEAITARVHGNDYRQGEKGRVKRALNSLVMGGWIEEEGGIYGIKKQGPVAGGSPEAPPADGDVASGAELDSEARGWAEGRDDV